MAGAGIGVREMSELTKKALVPVLRFPEFWEAGYWQSKKVGDICDFVVPGRSKPIEFSGDIPWITTPDLEQNGIVMFSKRNLKITKEEAKSIGSKIVPKNSIIISCAGELGVIAIAGVDLIINQQLHAFIPKESIYFRFLLYVLTIQKPYMEKIATKTAVPYMNKDNCNSIPVIMPNIPEQQKIADCLSSIDELVTAQTQKFEALKAHKKALMQQLFPAEGETLPKLRFPEFLEVDEWKIKPLDKLFTIGNGKDYKHLSAGDIPVYGSGGYMLSVNDFLYNGESVCIGRKGTINNPMFITGKFWTVDTLFYTHSFKSCSPKFIYLIFQNINWLNHNEAGGVPSLSKANIGKIEVAVPESNEQQKIANCLSSLDELITAQTQILEALKAHKKGMMQKLFPSIDVTTE
jgi:type I restriction enzyme S subunit